MTPWTFSERGAQYALEPMTGAINVPVLAGPTEATALGNALMQLVGLGELATLADVRAVAEQQPAQIFTPRSPLNQSKNFTQVICG